MSEEHKCVYIQRQWRLKKLKNALAILKFNKYTTKKLTFEQFTDKIKKQPVLNIINYILNKSGDIADYDKNINMIKPQEFLSAFVINGYTNNVISKEKPLGSESNDILFLEDEVAKLASDIIEIYDSFLYIKLDYELVKKFYKLLNKFKSTFLAWKTNDYKQIIHILTLSYHEIEATINLIINKNQSDEQLTDEEKKVVELSRKQQNNIEKKINFLNGQEYFNNYRPPEITLDESVEKHIRDIVHNAYWDMLKKELNNDPPQFNQLINILSEIRDTFCSFVPRRNDIHREMYENIDIDFIKSMAQNNAIDGTTIYNLAIYIVSLIKKFQPREMDEDIQNWEKDINTQFTNGFTYDEFLITFFKNVFTKLEAIKKATEDFQETELYARMIELYEERRKK